MTRDEIIAQRRAAVRAKHEARGGRRMIMREFTINEISAVDDPAGPTFATAIVYPNSNRVERLPRKLAETEWRQLFACLARDLGPDVFDGWRPLR
jgi:hypothetical protein